MTGSAAVRAHRHPARLADYPKGRGRPYRGNIWAVACADGDEENGQEPDSSGSGQPVLCYEEAEGCKDSQAKDHWAGIEALKRTRIAQRNLPLLKFLYLLYLISLQRRNTFHACAHMGSLAE